MDISGARGPNSQLTIRLRQLPCPMVDLSCVVALYNFEKHKFIAYGFPAAHQDSAVDEALRDMRHNLFLALRRLMADVAFKGRRSWNRS